MSNSSDLLNRINEKYSKMSKGQKLLAVYITDNYDKAVFLTAAKMGETVGVSESTVVRFATHLGYRGYPEFQRALEEMVRTQLNSVQRMEVTYLYRQPQDTCISRTALFCKERASSSRAYRIS